MRGLANELNRDPGVLSRWETGERTPKPTDVAQILTKLGVTGSRYDEVIDLTTGTAEKQWLAVSLPEHRQQLTALLDFERSAATITEVTPLLIPGLLQTSRYVRAIMSSGSVPEDEIETRVAVRLGRGDAIKRRDPAKFVALVGEAALRQVIGNREIMIEQLDYLLEASHWSNIDLRVLPFESGWHPALEGVFLLIESGDGAPVVHLENRRSGIFLHEKTDTDTYEQAVELASSAATTPEQSREIVAEAIKKLEARNDEAG